MVKKSLPALAVPIVFALGACSSDEAPTVSSDAGASTATATDGEGAAPSTSGSITLTIGEETWTFDSALCAYENAPAGEPGSEWNVSSTKGDYQVYVSEDSYGPRVSVADVVTAGSLEWVAEADAVTLTVEGNDIDAEGTFTDLNGEQQDGTLTASCPSWVGS